MAKNVIIYQSHFDLFDQLNDIQAGKLIKAIGKYEKGIQPTIDDDLVKGIFISIKRDFDIQSENYKKIVDRNRENGKKGGKPKLTEANPTNPMGILGTQVNPNNLKDKDKDKDKDNNKDIDKDYYSNSNNSNESISDYLADSLREAINKSKY